jgi:hypothetical protein
MLTKTAEMMKVLKMITEERMSALPTSKARHGAGRGSGKLTIGGTRSYVLGPQWLGPMLKLGRAKFSATFRSEWDEVTVRGDLDILGAEPRLLVSHSTRFEPAQTNKYKIELARTLPHLGGVRWWFLCPQTGRRVAKLYLPRGGDRFLSRQAYRLVHDTRQMSTSYRLSAKVNRIAAKLGAPGNDFCEPPEKPLGMRWRTYDRLVERWYGARDAYWGILDASDPRFFRRMRQKST